LLEKAGDGDFLRAVAEAVLQLLMESDVEGMIGAGRYERSGERTTWRNGYRDRSLDTRLGALQLRMLMGLTSTIMVGHLGSAAQLGSAADFISRSSSLDVPSDP
jgi:putative transposase